MKVRVEHTIEFRRIEVTEEVADANWRGIKAWVASSPYWMARGTAAGDFRAGVIFIEDGYTGGLVGVYRGMIDDVSRLRMVGRHSTFMQAAGDAVQAYLEHG